MIQIPDSMKKLLNVEEETEQKFVELANKEKAIMIAFIAPYTAVRISPIEEKTAHISLSEEFGIEATINEIKSKAKNYDKVYLLLNSPGGLVTSSYKIARALRRNFNNIIVFVPHMAASGGTLIALAGNEIVMGVMSQLSPLDVQVDYNDGVSVSVASLFRSFDRLSNFFRKTYVDEAPYPWKALADKLDPILMEEWSGTSDMMTLYTKEILVKSGFEDNKAGDISQKLTMSFPDHSFVIHYDQAKELGLNVKKDEDYPEVWNFMREWLGKYMLEATEKHVIRFIVPNQI